MESLVHAVKGKDVVISTANSAVPSQKGDNFKNDVKGHKNLFKACKDSLVKQFIYTSVFSYGPMDEKIPISRSKRRIESALKQSGIPYTIFQAPAFMDIYFAFMGTDLPLVHTEVSSLNRPFKFMQNFYKGVRKDIEENDKFNQIGKGDMPSSFIALENVADFHIAAISNPEATNQVIEIGGPEPLTTKDVKEIFEKAYDKELKVKATSPGIMKFMSKALSLFNINAANVMALNYASTQQPAVVENAQATADKFGVKLISAQTFIQNKMETD
jgi:NADH dehydrogenase